MICSVKLAGLSDSLKLLKEEMPGKLSYQLSILADEILEDGSKNAHNAEDVNMLSAILKGVPNVVEKTKKYTFTFESVLLNNRKLSNKKKLLPSFVALIQNSVWSKRQARLGYCFTPYQRLRLCNGAPFSRLLRHAGDTEDVFSA